MSKPIPKYVIVSEWVEFGSCSTSKTLCYLKAGEEKSFSFNGKSYHIRFTKDEKIILKNISQDEKDSVSEDITDKFRCGKYAFKQFNMGEQGMYSCFITNDMIPMEVFTL